MRIAPVRVVLGVALLAAPALAIDPAIEVTVLAQETQNIAGVGNITLISNLGVNDLGEHIVEVDTDNSDTNIDAAVLKNGVLFLQEGQPLPLPAGAALDSFDAVNLNNGGKSGWNLFLDNTGGTSNDSGIYLDTTLLIQEGDVTTVAGLTPGTTFLGFFETLINDSDDILIRCSMEDINLGDTVDQALIVRDAGGTQTLIAIEDTEPPGFGGSGIVIDNIESGAPEFGFNDNGDVLWACDTSAATTDDTMIFLNSTLLAREGSPSPVAGRNWDSLLSPEMWVNNDGDWVVSDDLDGDTATDSIIVKNGLKFIQEGDAPPGLPGFALTSFGSGPIKTIDRGAPDEDADVLWWGDWDDPDTTVDHGLFLDTKLLLQEGVDQIGGLAVDTVQSFGDAWDASPNGRYVLVEAVLAGSLETAVLLDLGPWERLGNGFPATTAPKLRAFGQLAANTATTVRLTNGIPNGTANLIIGLSQVNVPLLGGTLVPSPDVIVFGLPIGADGTLEFTANFPPGVPAGTKIVMQYWNDDPGAPFAFSASNAVVGTAQ